MSIRWSCLLLICACCLPFYSQDTPSPSQNSISADEVTFRVTSDTVLLDVVVTDNAGRPVRGLKKDQFHIFEDHNPQTITSFTPHDETTTPVAAKDTQSLPGAYSNVNVPPASGPFNVLLFDSLNTPLSDQLTVYKELVKFLQAATPGQPIALFAASRGLRMVHPFTTDPAKLLSALQNHQLNLDNSPLLRTSAELDTEASEVDMMKGLHADDAAAALKDFKEREAQFELDWRVESTLTSLQQLALYLSGIHGRKNVIWLSGSFPVAVLANSTTATDESRDYSEEIRKTTNLLSASQVALYPIDDRGMMVAPDTDAALTGRQRLPPGQAIRDFSTQTNFEHDSMENMARETGGRAFFNANGIAGSIVLSTNDGANYYSLAYTPTNKSDDGKQRKIEVQLDGVKAKLAYRRTYFARDSNKPKNPYTLVNTFDAAMMHGLPAVNQIVFTLHALPSDSQPAPSEVVEESKHFKGMPTRYQLDYATHLDDFTLIKQEDGLRHGLFVVSAVAYNPSGEILNSYRRILNVSFNQEQYDRFLRLGMQIHENLDLPVGEVLLRAGINDIASKKVGTLEIPLSVTTPAPAKPNPVEATVAPVSAPKHDDVKIPASIPDKIKSVSPPNPPLNPDLGFHGVPDDTTIAYYCQTATGGIKSSAALESACQFVLSLRRKLPNLICDREMRRHSVLGLVIAAKGRSNSVGPWSDRVAATVNYKDGLEYLSNVMINGQPIDAASPELAGSWSMGEFPSALEAIFAPLSHAEFKFDKETKLRKIPTLVFEFHVRAHDNLLYSLQAIYNDQVGYTTFPGYRGRLWLNKENFSLVRMERKTSEITPHFPISEASTIIDYARLPLGDGTNFVLATNADVLTCSPDEGRECSHNVVTYKNWHKFGAKSRIVAVGDEQK